MVYVGKKTSGCIGYVVLGIRGLRRGVSWRRLRRAHPPPSIARTASNVRTVRTEMVYVGKQISRCIGRLAQREAPLLARPKTFKNQGFGKGVTSVRQRSVIAGVHKPCSMVHVVKHAGHAGPCGVPRRYRCPSRQAWKRPHGVRGAGCTAGCSTRDARPAPPPGRTMQMDAQRALTTSTTPRARTARESGTTRYVHAPVHHRKDSRPRLPGTQTNTDWERNVRAQRGTLVS